ncbi:SpoIIE family protein phosphatase [Silvanigrella sp.]|jgi:sigma-B regulation protein RsbU (phosphoserine phosphatase)|uniref:SpoIIE family protein phosphatase n=1 Tax=Silvanigrella sp. TaxID=2024976 RepID=UPI0037C63ABC
MKLAPKIIILLLIVTLGVMSIYSFYQVRRAEKSFNADAEANHVLLLSNSLGFLSKSLWELDKDIAARGMKPLFEAETVINIQIYDAEGNFFSGFQYNLNKENKKELVEYEDRHKEKDLPAKELVLKKTKFDLVPSKMVSPMINLTDDKHRLVGSLWWKETEISDPKFLGFVVLNFSTEYIAKRLLEQKLSFILFTLGLSLSILVLTYSLLEKQVINPIRKLMQASLDIADGRFTRLQSRTRFQIGSGEDEIDKLTTNFNFMVDKIEHSLNMIRGLSEASQAIVKCMNINESIQIYEKYLKDLIRVLKVEVWLNEDNEASDESKPVVRVSDQKKMENKNGISEKLQTDKNFINEDSKFSFSDDYVNFSILAVPLLNSKNKKIGIIELYFTKGSVDNSDESRGIINSLTTSLITAIENDWYVLREKNRANLERDIELASAVQDSIISKSFPESRFYDSSTFFKTASQCGGDWFGVYEVEDGKILVLFGDVTGHGTPAALITAVTRGSADMLLQFIKLGKADISKDFPSQVLQFINECIVETGKQTYLMTMVAALIDFKNQKIFASSAGHTPPAIITTLQGKNEVKYIYPSTGSRLGFAKGALYETKEFEFIPGQKIIFYTDGIVEGESPKLKEYGLKNFKKSMESHGAQEPEEFIKNITNDAYTFFSGAPQKDDIALLAIRFLNEKENKNINPNINKSDAA